MADMKKHKLGWIGIGRMGYAMADRLAKSGCDIAVWNRTKAKAEPLAKSGAKVVDTLPDLAGCDIVFTMVSTGKDVKEVLFGANGVLSKGAKPKIVVDSTSISLEESAEIRAKLAEKGIHYLDVGTSGGVVRYDTRDDSFKLFDAKSGLLSNGAFYVGKIGGKLTVGTYGGGFSQLIDDAGGKWKTYNIPEGLAVSAPVYFATRSRWTAFWVSFLSGVAEPVGGLLGFVLFRSFPNPLLFGLVFAAVAGVMVYVSLDELLPAAREYGEHQMAIGSLMAGMAVMALSLVLLA